MIENDEGEGTVQHGRVIPAGNHLAPEVSRNRATVTF